MSVTCDVCKTEFNGAEVAYDHEVKWKGGCGGGLENTTVRISFGSNYGQDGGNLEIREYHVCPRCFQDVLEPFLEGKGAEPTEEELDF